jgi:hypothetical protein
MHSVRPARGSAARQRATIAVPHQAGCLLDESSERPDLDELGHHVIERARDLPIGISQSSSPPALPLKPIDRSASRGDLQRDSAVLRGGGIRCAIRNYAYQPGTVMSPA